MKKVLIGCGIVALLAVIAMVGTTMWVVNMAKQATPNTDRLAAFEQRMIDEFGEPQAFVPPLDGQYDPERIAYYLDVRDRLLSAAAPFRAEVLQMRNRARDQEGGGFLTKLRNLKANVQAGIGSVRSSVNYIGTADSILVEMGMGKGEYLHYNLLMLYDRLPESVSEISGARQKDLEFEMGMLRAFVHEGENLLLDQFDNARRQIGALESPSPQQEAWRERLYEEIADARADDATLPFRHELPASFAAALAPHDTRIAATIPGDIFESVVELVLAMEVEEEGGLKMDIESEP